MPDNDIITCPRCEGTRQTLLGDTCTMCHGTGRMRRDLVPCPRCEGLRQFRGLCSVCRGAGVIRRDDANASIAQLEPNTQRSADIGRPLIVGDHCPRCIGTVRRVHIHGSGRVYNVSCDNCGSYRITLEEIVQARATSAAPSAVRSVPVTTVPCNRCGGSGFEGSNTGYGAVCSYCGGACEMPVTRPFPNRPCAVSVHGDQSECLHPGCGASWDTNFEPNNEPPNCPNRPEVPMREALRGNPNNALRDRMRRDAGAGTQRVEQRGALPDVMWQTTPDPRTRAQEHRARTRAESNDQIIRGERVDFVMRGRHAEYTIIDDLVPNVPTVTYSAHAYPQQTPSRLIARLRGPGIFGDEGWATFRSLVAGQQLWLKRDPTNTVDPLAVIVQTLEGSPCGFVAKEFAARIAADLDRDMLSWQCIMSASLPFLQLDRKT